MEWVLTDNGRPDGQPKNIMLYTVVGGGIMINLNHLRACNNTYIQIQMVFAVLQHWCWISNKKSKEVNLLYYTILL